MKQKNSSLSKFLIFDSLETAMMELQKKGMFAVSQDSLTSKGIFGSLFYEVF